MRKSKKERKKKRRKLRRIVSDTDLRSNKICMIKMGLDFVPKEKRDSLV